MCIVTLGGVFLLFEETSNQTLLAKEDFFNEHITQQDNFLYSLFSKTKQQIASVLSVFEKETILLPIEFKRQENALSCEVASLRMVLNYLGLDVTESDLLDNIEYSATSSRTISGVWGDPQKGFVGNVNGSVVLGTGYGVYNIPIRNLAQKYRNAETMEQPNLDKIISHTKQGRPVIVWGLLANKTPIYWISYEGKLIKAYRGEHARIVIGYTGNISNPSNIILMDPLYGKVKMSTERFITEWGMLDYMAVVVE